MATSMPSDPLVAESVDRAVGTLEAVVMVFGTFDGAGGDGDVVQVIRCRRARDHESASPEPCRCPVVGGDHIDVSRAYRVGHHQGCVDPSSRKSRQDVARCESYVVGDVGLPGVRPLPSGEERPPSV